MKRKLIVEIEVSTFSSYLYCYLRENQLGNQSKTKYCKLYS